MTRVQQQMREEAQHLGRPLLMDTARNMQQQVALLALLLLRCYYSSVMTTLMQWAAQQGARCVQP